GKQYRTRHDYECGRDQNKTRDWPRGADQPKATQRTAAVLRTVLVRAIDAACRRFFVGADLTVAQIDQSLGRSSWYQSLAVQAAVVDIGPSEDQCLSDKFSPLRARRCELVEPCCVLDSGIQLHLWSLRRWILPSSQIRKEKIIQFTRPV